MEVRDIPHLHFMQKKLRFYERNRHMRRSKFGDAGFRLFSFRENADHVPGEADAVILGGQAIPGVPIGHGKLGFVDVDLIAAVHIAEKAHQHIAVHAPGLALVVAQVFHPQAHFFHHFPLDALFQRFADLGVARQEGVVGVGPAGVFAQQQPLAVGHRHDHHGIDPGEDQIAAAGAAEHPLLAVVLHGGAAAAAEAVGAVPVVKMPACQNGEANFLADQLPQLAHRLIGEAAVGGCGGGIGPEEIVLPLHPEQVAGCSGIFPGDDAGKAGQSQGVVSVAAQQHLALMKAEDPVLLGRSDVIKFVFQAANGQILKHGWYSLRFFLL